MARNYANYSQYLGSQRCCNLNTLGPGGPQGPAGPAGIGPQGNIGNNGPTGPTGRSCKGPTGSKSFIMDHPIDSNKYLVHVCLEGPEAGVYYRGKGEITNNEFTEIELPYYVNELACEFTIQITPIYCNKVVTLNSSEVENNKFMVYGENSKFYWVVYGKRYDIDVEPNKENVTIKGTGPYKYI